jgi:hypothetical protein
VKSLLRWSHLAFVAPGRAKRGLRVVNVASGSEIAAGAARNYVGDATDVVGPCSQLGEPNHSGVVQQRAAVFLD